MNVRSVKVDTLDLYTTTLRLLRMNCKIFRIKNGQFKQLKMTPVRLTDYILRENKNINNILIEIDEKIVLNVDDDTWQGLECDDNRVG